MDLRESEKSHDGRIYFVRFRLSVTSWDKPISSLIHAYIKILDMKCVYVYFLIPLTLYF